MMAVTVVLALMFSGMALVVRPGRALGLIILCTMIWPEYIRIPMGLAQMSAPRFVAIALIARCVIWDRSPVFRWKLADSLVVLLWAWIVVSAFLNNSEQAHLSNMIGRVFDNVFMYFAARLAIRDASSLRDLFTPIAITGVLLGIIGFYESYTGDGLYLDYLHTVSWFWIIKDQEVRFGFFRAYASTPHPLYFGMAMGILTGIAWSLKPYVKSHGFWLLGVGGCLLAMLSSVSSGPFLMLMVLLISYLLYMLPVLRMPFFVFVLLASLAMEFASNRHFYNLIDYLAINKTTAWYRSRLLEVAATNLSEYWAIGVGSNWPQHWGMQIDGRRHVDVVNHYLIIALRGGLLGVFMWIGIHVSIIVAAIKRRTRDPVTTRRVLYGCVATIVTVDMGSMSCGLFGPPDNFTYILLGMTLSIASMPSMKTRGPRPVVKSAPAAPIAPEVEN